MKKNEPAAPLTARQLAEYREWLSDLTAEAAESGRLGECDPEVWEYFDPSGPTGFQILSSLTEQELMAPVLATMDRPGHTPQFDRVYVIYRRYLAFRYGSMNAAKFRARALYKQKQDAALCPPGWQKRVSPEPLLAWCREQGILVSEADRTRLAALCAGISRKGLPLIAADVRSETRGFLNSLTGNWRKGFAMMGVPVISKKQMPHVQSAEDKRKKAESP